MNVILATSLMIGTISAFAGISDDIINASLRCQQMGKKIESCIPKEVIQSSTEANLTYRILINCEKLDAPLLACYDVYSASILRQKLGMNVNDTLPHFTSQILEDVRNSLSRKAELGLDIKKEILND